MAAFKTKSKVDPKVIQPFIQTAVDAFGYDRLCFEANCTCTCTFQLGLGVSVWLVPSVPLTYMCTIICVFLNF